MFWPRRDRRVDAGLDRVLLGGQAANASQPVQCSTLKPRMRFRRHRMSVAV